MVEIERKLKKYFEIKKENNSLEKKLTNKIEQTISNANYIIKVINEEKIDLEKTFYKTHFLIKEAKEISIFLLIYLLIVFISKVF